MAIETNPTVGSLTEHAKLVTAAQAELGKKLADATAASAPGGPASEQ